MLVIRQDKFDGIAVGYPREALAKAHMVAFIDRPVARETFTKMRVQMLLIDAGATAPKCNRVYYGGGSLGHKIKTLTLHVVVHSG